tara:strand:+ start:13083 stop:14876 length:1794 start_codon:yes stop_codon:yes gene_type:complete
MMHFNMVITFSVTLRFIVILVLQVVGVMQVAAAGLSQNIQLNPAEKAWLADHKEIVLASTSDFYPFEFFDDKGSYRGVSMDYFALIEKRLGFRFKIVPSVDRDKSLAQIRSKDVDMMVLTSTEGEGYDGYMLFTQPHITMPGVIIGKQEYKTLDKLKGKKLAVVSGTQWEDFISNSFEHVQSVPVPDMASGLELVSLNKVDALLSDMATSSYYIHREGMTDIHIVGSVEKDLEIRLAIRKDWPELKHIMEKALKSISADEKKTITRQWIHLKQPTLLLDPTFWMIAFAVLMIILLMIMSILIWNYTLKKQVLQRTQSLSIELQRRQKAESELQSTHADLIKSHRELKQTQLHLIHAEKMESVGLLAAGVAHEVKNPLAVIMLGMDYVASVLSDKDVDTTALQDMNDAVSRADSVINSLLDFSREETLNRSASDLNKVIDDSLYLVKHELAHNNIDIVKVLDESILEVLLDTNKIQQVFVNLFMNATQAMKTGGTIKISTFQTKIDAKDHIQILSKNVLYVGQHVVIAEVSDDGPGVDDKQLQKLFDPFYTTKPIGEGTGLGLSIARNIVDLHDGAIEVKNLDTGGLLFNIILPTIEG